MTKSQIIRELTIELATKCKLARELDRDLNVALSRNLELNDELLQERVNRETNEREYLELVLEHVGALEEEIELMRSTTMSVFDYCNSTGTLYLSRDKFKKALGIIK